MLRPEETKAEYIQIPLLSDDEGRGGSFTKLCEALGVDPKQSGWVDTFGKALRLCSEQVISRPISVLSLFSGAGGLDIGFHDAGFKILAMLEIEEKFVATLKANSGEGKYLDQAKPICGDIQNYVPPHDIDVDFIIGGPPCQSFSAAGRRAAGVMGTADKRGKLFEEYVRLLKILKPKGFLFENVYGIVGAEKGTAWKKICDAFQDAGYRISYRVLDAADYGVPQHRERMIIVGTMEADFKFPYPTHGPDSIEKLPYVTASEAVSNVQATEIRSNSRVGGRFGHLLYQVPPGLNYSFFTEKMGHPNPIFAWRSKFSDFLYKADPFTPTRTLKAQGGQYTGPFHWDNRPFSVEELKCLQTFPNAYNIVGGRQVSIQQIGNSVPPQLARILAISVLVQLFKVNMPYVIPLMESKKILGFRKRKRRLTAVYRYKAQENIDSLNLTDKEHSLKIIKKHTYNASLSACFAWNVADIGNLCVKFVPNKTKWSISVSLKKIMAKNGFTISVTSVLDSLLALKVSKVELKGSELEKNIFVGAWKAFEAELIRYNIKADIVQLCGYYQYKPAFKCEMSFIGDKPVAKEWSVVQAVVAGRGVGEILSYKDISYLWEINEKQVLKFATWLRRLGYEVRNNLTNPQIPPNFLLVPYVFPTLNPMSVQLGKSLEAL